MAGLRRPQPGCYCLTAAAVNLLLGVFQVLLPCCRPGGAQGQAIEPLPNVVELWQAEEGELLLPTQGDSEEDMEEQSQEQSFSDKLFSGKALHFQPSVLDFGVQFLGHPAAKILYAYNPSGESEVVVNSVFTAAGHFHVPPVHCRVIPAMGKTSFRIIFLPTEEGSIESSLFINTSSHGVLSYHVSGIGTRRISAEGSVKQLPNAYFLLPQVQSVQLSQTQAETTNTSLLQVQLECSLHNKVCQQLKSCYVESDDVLRLQMSIIVTMENASKEFEENTQDLLDHLSIIYVATDKSETSDDSAVNMYILHSGNSLIWIQDVHHFSQRDALSLQFEPVLLPTSTTNFTKIASFTCKAPSCDSGMREDRKKKNTPTLKACLSSPVAQGYFRMDSSATQFHIETHENTSGLWSMWYLNRFDRGVVLNDVFVSKETKRVLKILNFTGPLFLPPGCWKIFSLKLAVKDFAINLFTRVFLTTNIGAVFAVPLQIYLAPTKEGSLGFEVIAHCGMHYFMGKSKAENPNWEGSLSLDWSTWDVDSELANTLYERWKKLKNGDVCKRNVLGMTRFAHSKKSKESEPFALFLPRLIPETGLVLNFSATALRNSVVKYFVVKNPSSSPVSLQLLPVSLYPKPEAAARLLHKWFGTDVQMINFTTSEFQLTKACPYRGVHSEESRFGILHLHLQPLERKRVGVVFTPADYGKVTSLILIRNNLTVIDMIGVEGFGARELLKVGGRLPGTGGSLRFKVPESTLMGCRRQLKDSKQILSITKNFKVENIGPLPITVTSLKINGYNCQGYGFEVLDCQQFSLDPNTSRDISIVFTPDFTSSWVIRELTLVTAADLEFRFTLNVTLPHHLLPLCADVVPGPSWEESFWRLTVFFVSLSLLGVILIAFQQAQYILMEFMKTRQRQNASSSSHQSNSPMDVISSHSHKSNCKNFLDTYSPSDKGRGKSCLPVNPPQSRIQNATKRSPATYSHSQKKHKCSVYYGKHKASAAVAGSASAPAEDKQASAPGGSLAAAKEDACPAGMGEAWVGLKYTGGLNVNLQKNLTLPKNLLSKEENTLKNAIAVSNTSSECHMKEGVQTCMFPKETDLQISENIAELKEREVCPLKTPKKLPENHLPRNSPQCQSDLPEISRKNNGNNQQVPVKNEVDNCETLKKVDTKSSSEKKIHKASKEDVCSEKQDVPSVEQEDPYRKKKLQEKKDGNLQNLNWNKNRACRKNKKRGAAQVLRPSEQSELKLVCSEFERSELSSDIDLRSWCIQENPGEACKTDAGIGSSLPASQGEAEGYFQKPGKKRGEKSCSDSSSDCGSSSGSVRASRGSWGSWSSASSSDGDKKPMLGPQHFLPPGDSVSQNDFPSEAPISLNLSHNICNPTDVSSFPRHADAPCPSLPAGPAAVEEDKGLYPPGDLWPAQPVCVTSGFGCALESSGPAVLPAPAPVHSSSFIDWNAACEGQFPSVYCPLELNDYNAFPEENINYPNGFPCPAEVQTDFIDHSSQSAWNSPPNVPTAWGHAGLISSPPYLTSTRSLSPMSGLFGSIWAPQSDVYENCCPVNPTTEHSTHMENQAVMCKEYYPGFNPFRAYMDLDIWTSTANRSANFPLSRDSSYCGNV
ncbi:transmembrane protein 131-like isoform X1 [Balaenoptera acutorostrata]|uniref:Transmembrane protein 131-like isoform X1 n=3 Tax=Balaenoptera acutorostrata TaxID=9767 RepID=A0ABM3TL47_BALAC|nr:transmembrane protein 131-like isoform X1 [Balaenoptera acutorostrata]